VRIWLGARVEETSYLDGFFSQVFQITDNVLSFPVKRREINAKLKEEVM
jgi:hypothetical protein